MRRQFLEQFSHLSNLHNSKRLACNTPEAYQLARRLLWTVPDWVEDRFEARSEPR